MKRVEINKQIESGKEYFLRKNFTEAEKKYYECIEINKENALELIPEIESFSEYYIPNIKIKITNIGLLIFSNDDDILVAYDITEKVENNIDEIDHKNSDKIIQFYNLMNNPLNIRTIYIKNKKFEPLFNIVDGENKIIKIDADYLKTNKSNIEIEPDNNGFFHIPEDSEIVSIGFNMKQSFLIKHYGTEVSAEFVYPNKLFNEKFWVSLDNISNETKMEVLC